MNKRSHSWFLLVLVLLSLLPVLLVWRILSTTNVTDLWIDSTIRKDFLINIAASLAFEVGVGLLLLFRGSITRWVLALVLRGRSLLEERERVEHERLYLENLVERFSREFPWETEKYTDLEAIQEDLEEQARRVQPRLWQLPDSEETRADSRLKSHVNVRLFLRKEKGPIMLKGDPGTGKTLTIRRFAVDQANRALRHLPAEVQIPVYVSLAFYTGHIENAQPETVYDFLQRYIAEEYPAATYLREHLREYLVQGRLLLLFDGLNELPPDEYVQRYEVLEEFVLRRYPKNKAVFTCRTLRHTSLSRFQTVVISDLDDGQIKRFITAYRGEQAAEILYRDLTSGDGFMLRVCRNPFMLQMLVRRNPSRPTPQSPSQLFAEYVCDQLASASADVEQTSRVLCEVAFAMQQSGVFAGTVDRNWIETEVSVLDLEDHLNIACQAQLIDYTHEGRIRFYHQILQEYFAAVALRRDWQTCQDIGIYLVDYRWEETILVCAGIVETTEAFVCSIWSSSDDPPERLQLAVKAVGSSGNRVSAQYYRSLMHTAERYLGLGWDNTLRDSSRLVLAVETVKALSYVDDAQTAALLSSALKKHDGWVRELCIQALGSSRHPSARPLLYTSVADLRSLRTLLLVAPYCETREWLELVARSALSFWVLLRGFQELWRWLWILFPALISGLLYGTARFLSMHPVVLVGRLMSIQLLLILVYARRDRILDVFKPPRGFSSKLKEFGRQLTWVDASLTVAALVCWIFAGEVLAVTFLLVMLGWYAGVLFAAVTCVRKLRHPADLASYLYYSGRLLMFASLLIGVTYLLERFLPAVRRVPPEPGPHRSISGVETTLNMICVLLLHPFISLPVLGVQFLIGLASSVVHLRTFWLYWRVWRYRKLFVRDREAEAVQQIVDIATNASEWPHIRERAVKALRLVDVPTDYVEVLEDLAAGEPTLRRELERTVYELRARARERDRVAPPG
jgi:hypothetical protein